MSTAAVHEAIAAAGYQPPPHIEYDGTIHRWPTTEQKRSSLDGWYVAFDDPEGQVVVFGSWRDNSKHVWSTQCNGNSHPDEVLSVERKRQVAEQQRALRQKIREERNRAAARYQRVYEQAETKGHSEYLRRKQLNPPEGVRFVTGLDRQTLGIGGEGTLTGVLMPICNSKGVLRTVQFIPDGEGEMKLLAKGGEKAGCWHTLSGDTVRHIAIGEGLATVASVVEATGYTGIVAVDSGNLPKVAEQIGERYPAANVYLLKDNDEAGDKACRDAQRRAQRSQIVSPPPGFGDFNDVHCAQGLAAVRACFPVAQDEVSDSEWKKDLLVKNREDGTSVILSRVSNLVLILEHAEEWRGRLAFDELASAPTIDRQELDDNDLTTIKMFMERYWITRERVATTDIKEAVLSVAKNHTYHPVRQYLDGLEWDGIDRISHFFTDLCGTPLDAYHSAAARSLFVSAVARIYQPGCKVDTMVILHSEQGWGKTEIWPALFGDDHTSEMTSSLDDKDFFMGLRGIWCADFGELDQFSRSEQTRIKQVLTIRTDKYRPMWGTKVKPFPRQCVFVGGTNEISWNKDPSGARRFLPIHMAHPVDIDQIKDIRDQLWAEAVRLYRREEPWWNIPYAQEHQDAIYDMDAWEEIVHKWASDKLSITVADALQDALNIEPGRITRSDQIRMGNALRHLGWIPKKETINGVRCNVYRRKNWC